MKISTKLFILFFLFSLYSCYTTRTTFTDEAVSRDSIIEYIEPKYSSSLNTTGWITFGALSLGATTYDYYYNGSELWESALLGTGVVTGSFLLYKAFLDGYLKTGDEEKWLKDFDENLEFVKAKYGKVVSSSTLMGKTTEKKEITSIFARYKENIPDDNTNESNLSSSKFLSNNIGTWKGIGNQFNNGHKWDIEIKILKNKKIVVSYPSLLCGGSLKLLKQSEKSAEFEELIENGKDKCLNNGKIVLINDYMNSIVYKYYYDDGTYGAYGQLYRENNVVLNITYALRVGTYSTFQEAKKNYDYYVSKRYVSLIKEIFINGKNYFCVLVGEYPSSEVANSAIPIIKRNSDYNPIVVVKETGLSIKEKQESIITSDNSPIIPKAPPILVLGLPKFEDKNKNDIIDANEYCKINFWIGNKGEGDAYNVKIGLEEMNGINGLEYSTLTLDKVEPGKKIDISIPIYSNYNIPTGQAKFKIEALEENGFDVDPVIIAVNTQAFMAPKVSIVDYQFASKTGGKIETSTPITLRLLIQNIGQSKAENINLKLLLFEKNLFSADENTKFIGSLESGSYSLVDYEFFTNKRFDHSSINITAEVTESFGKYGEYKILSIPFNQPLPKINEFVISGTSHDSLKITPSTLLSDVDKNIPKTNYHRPNSYALIIGNEEYNTYLPNEPNVEFAMNDAAIFKEYCIKTLGIPEENIQLKFNLTSIQMTTEIENFSIHSQLSKEPIEIIFYYSGHGNHDENKESYILPLDCDESHIKKGIKLSDLYNSLSKHEPSRVTVFLDACFSGSGKGTDLFTSRGMLVKPKPNTIYGNCIVFSATSDNKSAYPYKEKNHGMFTYFLLKKLQETEANVNYGDLSDYLIINVKKTSKSSRQEPCIQGSIELGSSWRQWKLVE